MDDEGGCYKPTAEVEETASVGAEEHDVSDATEAEPESATAAGADGVEDAEMAEDEDRELVEGAAKAVPESGGTGEDEVAKAAPESVVAAEATSGAEQQSTCNLFCAITLKTMSLYISLLHPISPIIFV